MSCTVQGETSGAPGWVWGGALGGDWYVPPWFPGRTSFTSLQVALWGKWQSPVAPLLPASRQMPRHYAARRAACSGRNFLPFAFLHTSGVFCGDELSHASSYSFPQDNSVFSFPSPSIHLRHWFAENYDKERQQDGCQQYVIAPAHVISRSRTQRSRLPGAGPFALLT